MRNDVLIIGASVVAAVIIIKAARESGALDAVFDPEDQTGSFIDQIPIIEDFTNMASNVFNVFTAAVDASQEALNLSALLAVIRKSEGTDSNEGYQALFGWRPGNGKVFTSFADHPRQFFNYTDNAGKTIRTSAAGAYQITATTHDALVKNYPEFSGAGFGPNVQTDMAIKLIKERGALGDAQAGRLETAIKKIRPVWASLPGAGVNQPERSMAYVTQAFIDAGGVLA